MAGENQTVKKTNRHCPVRRLLAPSIALAGLVAVPAALAAPAFAEEPEQLKSTVTDTAGVISNEKALQDALASARDKTHKSVYIVFVKNFGSKTTDTWAKEAFRKSGLSRSDSLIAVATETNRFSLFAGGSGYSVAELRKALDGSGVYDKWRSGDWAGGAKSVVSNLEENATKKEGADSKGAGESKGSGLSGSTAALLIGVPAVGAGAAGGVYVWRRRKKGKELEAKNADDLASLSKRAARQLLETDDGVRGAAAELEFARAEFGVEATKQFAEALAFAQDSLQKAFVVRQALDDDIPETPQQQWEMNQRILALTASAREAITAALVRAQTSSSSSRLGPVSIPSELTSVTTKRWQPVAARRSRVSAHGPPSVVQPRAAMRSPRTSRPMATRSPWRSMICSHHSGRSRAAVPMLTRRHRVARALFRDSSSLIPPESSTLTSSLLMMPASRSALEPRPKAASRSTRWIQAAPSSCHLSAAESGSPNSFWVPAIPWTSWTA